MTEPEWCATVGDLRHVHAVRFGVRERQVAPYRGQLAVSEAEMCQHLPACPDGTPRTARPRESWPIIPGKGGACCATARSCSRTGARCSPMARRSRLPTSAARPAVGGAVKAGMTRMVAGG